MIINDFYQILYLKLSFLYTVQSISVGEAEAEEQGEPHQISESYQVVFSSHLITMSTYSVYISLYMLPCHLPSSLKKAPNLLALLTFINFI